MNLRLIGIPLIASIGIGPAQTVPVARSEFVASIKPHQPSPQTNGPRRVGMSFSGMRANVEGMTAYGLIGFAYDLRINGLREVRAGRKPIPSTWRLR